MSKILNFSNKYTGFGVSAIDSVLSRSILRGRPFGGVATLIRNDYLIYTNCLKCSERYNIVAVGNAIFINVYCPCSSSDSADIIASILAEINDVVALYPGYELIMGGDFNTV